MTGKLIVIALLGILCASVYCDDDDKKNTPKSPLDYLTNPKFTAALAAAEKLKNLIHRSSSSHIQQREKTSGFEFLDISANAQSSLGLPKRLLKRIIARNLTPFSKDSKDMKAIVESFKEFVEYDIEEHQEQFFAIVSKKGDGKTHAIFVYFKLREDGKYNFKKMLFRGKFRLAADLVITRSTKKGFFSSSSKDIINYLPRRGITAKDVNDLLDIIVPKIALVMNEFVPPEKN